MWGVAGMVITVSPRVRVADLERMARSRVARDGVAELAAVTADARQRRQLRRVGLRLAADPGLDVFFGDRSDGATYLTAFPAGLQRAIWWSGGPRRG
jgi:hypothetical protein